MDTFGKRLKALRNDRDLSQDGLANELNRIYHTNINKGMISKWENDKEDPRMEYVRNIAEYFLVSLDYLLCLSDIKRPRYQVTTDSINQDKEKTSIDTIAAHLEGKNLTPKKLKLIEQYIDALFEDGDEE